MQFMLRMYEKILHYSRHEHAPRYLAAISFIEASVFPIPPYVMLAPMAVARPNKALNFATIATIASVLGGVLGYYLGLLLFKPLVLPLIEYFGYIDIYNEVLKTFNNYGLYALLLLGVTPIPYKFVAISSGFLSISLPLFIGTSLLSRGLKFFAVALCIKLLGPNIEDGLRKLLEKFGYVFMGLIGILVVISLKVI